MSSLSSVAASFICRRRHYLSARSIFFQKLAQPRFVSSLCSSNFGTQYNEPENRGHPISYHGPSTPYHGPVPGTLLPNGHGKNNFHHCFSSAAAAIEEDDHDQLLPTHHSRKLPPAVCPPSLLRSEVEAIFDAPVGSLIVYDSKSSSSNANELKSVQEELSDVYYAADEAVQRVEYILRGLNAVVSEGSFVSRALGVGDMTLEGQDDASSGGGGEGMSKNDAFRAMLDLIDRMEAEGSAYAELRKRVRSQLTLAGGADDGESSDSSSSSSSSSDDDDDDDDGEDYFDQIMRRDFGPDYMKLLDDDDGDSDEIDEEILKIFELDDVSDGLDGDLTEMLQFLNDNDNDNNGESNGRSSSINDNDDLLQQLKPSAALNILTFIGPNDREYSILRPLRSILLVGKEDPDDFTRRMLLTDEEMKNILPRLERSCRDDLEKSGFFLASSGDGNYDDRE
mmetsp:Transcript_15765/g.29925  ORF Transcript_15765/g.29925 Transcript_15765/m.29925 type:complete len:452 (-) Transcript_15765:8-1363(-)